MTDDLKLIKRAYGEKMMHFCRENFSAILDTPGLLYETIKSHFVPSKLLYNDLKDSLSDFVSYIENLSGIFKSNNKNSELTPFELMKKAGYTLYECKTEEDIQSFRHYYYNPDGTPEYKGEQPIYAYCASPGEELCTFSGNRLSKCIVFFAVKDNVDEIKRENFNHPMRQDKYGTSVISIQITKDDSHTLSIKNRYNHAVANPDATFSNDLENVIEGLTSSFEKYLNLKINSNKEKIELENYVLAGDGRHYKYNLEINNVYYCPNNIIIDNFKIKYLDKEKYILMDNMLLTLTKPQKIECLSYQNVGFINLFKSGIKRVDIKNNDDTKEIVIECNDNIENKIILNDHNQIVIFTSNTKENIDERFMSSCPMLEELNLPNANIECNIGLDYNFLHRIKKCNLDFTNYKHLYMNLRGLTSAEGLKLPKIIGGELNLSGLTSAKGLVLPQSVGTLYLNNLASVEGLVLPKNIKKIDLSNLVSAKGLVLPETIVEDLTLNSLESTEGLIFPNELTYIIHMNGFDITPENVDEYRKSKRVK